MLAQTCVDAGKVLREHIPVEGRGGGERDRAQRVPVCRTERPQIPFPMMATMTWTCVEQEHAHLPTGTTLLALEMKHATHMTECYAMLISRARAALLECRWLERHAERLRGRLANQDRRPSKAGLLP